MAALQCLWRGPSCHAAEVLPSGAAFLGTTRANVLILLGACKLLALLDLWVLNLMPRITCLCVACMMGTPSLLTPYKFVLARRASPTGLSRVPACRLCTHAYLLTELPTDLLGLVTYCHHSIGDDLPPPVVMCAAMLCDMDMRHGSSRHGSAATLRSGCNSVHLEAATLCSIRCVHRT